MIAISVITNMTMTINCLTFILVCPNHKRNVTEVTILQHLPGIPKIKNHHPHNFQHCPGQGQRGLFIMKCGHCNQHECHQELGRRSFILYQPSCFLVGWLVSYVFYPTGAWARGKITEMFFLFVFYNFWIFSGRFDTSGSMIPRAVSKIAGCGAFW